MWTRSARRGCSRPWRRLENRNQDRPGGLRILGELGAHDPHLRQLEHFFCPPQAKLDLLEGVEGERLDGKALHLLSGIITECDGDVGSWILAEILKLKPFFF